MRVLRTARLPQDPAVAAIWWATCRQVDPARLAAGTALSAWVSDPANAPTWDEVDRRVGLAGRFASMPEARAMRAGTLEIAHGRRARRGEWRSAPAIAARSL